MASSSTPPRKQRAQRSVTAVRFPVALHEQLREAADDRDLSVNYLVVKAVEEFLERMIPADELRLTRPVVDAGRSSAA